MKPKQNNLTVGYPKFKSVLLILLIMAGAINVLQFREIERNAGPYHRAIKMYSGHDIVDIAKEHMTTTRERDLFYLEIGKSHPNAHLLTHRSMDLNMRNMYGLAKAEAVTFMEYDHYISRAIFERIEPHIIYKGTNRRFGEYVVASSFGPKHDQSTSYLITLTYKDRLLFVDLSLVFSSLVN